MKVLAINGSPRKKWNTAQLLEKIVEGAKETGAQTELIHLKDLTYKGCISCFRCKRLNSSTYGRCVIKDDLQPVLQKAHEADVLILGTPIYLAMESSWLRALMERLFFQYNIYTSTSLAPTKKATALVYTMNVSEEMSKKMGLEFVSGMGKGWMERLFKAPCTTLFSYETLQYDDYSKYESYSNGEARQKRHADVFMKELQAAFEVGKQFAS